MKRTCDSCGKEKDIKGGKTCEKGHFICSSENCKGRDGFLSSERSKCPICSKPLK